MGRQTREFAAVLASWDNPAHAGRVVVGAVILHEVRSAGHAAALASFWRPRRESLPGIIEALGWLAERAGRDDAP